MEAESAKGFLHDADASSDPKMVRIRINFDREWGKGYGWAAIGLYWLIIERLRGTYNDDDYKMPEEDIQILEYELRIEDGWIQQLVGFCTNKDNFPGSKNPPLKRTNGSIHAPSLDRRMERFHRGKERKSKAGKKGADARWGKPPHIADSNAVAMRSDCESNPEPKAEDGFINKTKNKTEKKTESKSKSIQKLKDAAMEAGIPIGTHGKDSLNTMLKSWGPEKIMEAIERAKIYWLAPRGKIRVRKYRKAKRWSNFIELSQTLLTDEGLAGQIIQEMTWEGRALEIDEELERNGLARREDRDHPDPEKTTEEKIEHYENIIQHHELELKRLRRVTAGKKKGDPGLSILDRQNFSSIDSRRAKIDAAKKKVAQIYVMQGEALLEGPADATPAVEYTSETERNMVLLERDIDVSGIRPSQGEIDRIAMIKESIRKANALRKKRLKLIDAGAPADETAELMARIEAIEREAQDGIDTFSD